MIPSCARHWVLAALAVAGAAQAEPATSRLTLLPSEGKPYVSRTEPVRVWMDKSAYLIPEKTAGVYLAVNESLRDRTVSISLGSDGQQVWRDSLKVTSPPGLAGQLDLGGLPAGNYQLKISSGTADFTWPFSIAVGNPQERPLKIPLQVSESRLGMPAYAGIPLPPGITSNPDEFALVTVDGQPVPFQITPRARWEHGGSLRWIGLSCRPPATNLILKCGVAPQAASEKKKLLSESESAIRLDTGPFQATLPKSGSGLWLTQVVLDGTSIHRDVDGLSLLEGRSQSRYFTSRDSEAEVRIVENGPERATVRIASWFVNEQGKRLCRHVSWLHFFVGEKGFDLTTTWIMTEDSDEAVFGDIALRIPLQDGRRGVFATDGRQIPVTLDSAPVYLLQFDYGKNTVQREGTKEPLAEGTHGDGWAAAWDQEGVVAVGARDFWENYPKEVSLTADAITLHLWPLHGRDDWQPPQGKTFLNMPWLHHSKWLNFVVPSDDVTFRTGESTAKYYVQNSSGSNALGVAKTHQLAVRFLRPDTTETEVDQLMTKTLQPATMTVAPEAMVASGVFGPISVADPEEFPEAEALIENSFKSETELGYRTGDYGMFVLGGRHDGRSGDGWALYRGWRLLHHGSPRTPWHLFARSGDPYYAREGNRISLNCMDFGICHFSKSPYDDASPTYPWRKRVGGLTDYKGYVPWYSGARVGDYNTMTDFLFLFDYINGEWRGSEVAAEMVNAIREEKGQFIPDGKVYGPRDSDREQAGTFSGLLDYYENTLDPALIPLLHTLYAQISGAQSEKGAFSGSQNYAPWLERYYRLTRDPDAGKRLVRWADAVIELSGAQTQVRDNAFNILAAAWFVSRDPKYLEYGRGLLFEELHSAVRDPEDPDFGFYAPSVSFGSNLGQRLPLFLEALKASGNDQDTMRWMRERSILSPVKKKNGLFEGEAWFLKQDDEAVNMVFGESRACIPIPGLIEVFAPNGNLVLSYDGRGKNSDFSDWVRLQLPGDSPQGLYRVQITAPKAFAASVPFTEGSPEMYAFPSGPRIDSTSRMAFRFPEEYGSTEVTVRYEDGHLPVSVIRRDNEVTQFLHDSADPVVLSYTPEDRDILMVFYRHRERKGRQVLFQGNSTPQYYASSLDRLFNIEDYLTP